MRLRSWLRRLALLAAIALPSLAAPALLRAQSRDAAAPVEKKLGPADIIMPHITDSKTIEYPCYKGAGEWACAHTFAVHNVTVGGHTFDMGLTKHIFFMILAGVIVCLLLINTARSHKKHSDEVCRPKG